MHQLAPRGAQTSQEHATNAHLLRDHIDPTTTLPPYSAVDTMQHNPPSPMDGLGGSDTAGHYDGPDGPDGRKSYGKRELSTSKRAAQNRAAQRAFRQRKEGYIKKLEEQVRDYSNLSESYKSLQQENYQLRDYILKLQSRLLDSQGEVPPPPANLNGLEPEHAHDGRPLAHPQRAPPLPNHLSAHPGPGAGTLPRLSELATMSSPASNLTAMQPPAKDLTPAQAALQGSSILQNPPPPVMQR